MKKLKILFFIFVLFFTFQINTSNAGTNLVNTRITLVNTEKWEIYADKIDDMIDYMKTDHMRLRLLNRKIKSLSAKIGNINWKRVNQLKIILEYISQRIENELPKNEFKDDVDPNNIKNPEKVRSL